jgi:hypothetical protein
MEIVDTTNFLSLVIPAQAGTQQRCSDGWGNTKPFTGMTSQALRLYTRYATVFITIELKCISCGSGNGNSMPPRCCAACA